MLKPILSSALYYGSVVVSSLISHWTKLNHRHIYLSLCLHYYTNANIAIHTAPLHLRTCAICSYFLQLQLLLCGLPPRDLWSALWPAPPPSSHLELQMFISMSCRQTIFRTHYDEVFLKGLFRFSLFNDVQYRSTNVVLVSLNQFGRKQGASWLSL